MPSDEKKPVVDLPQKSSMEILSELFSTFDAEPPLIIKKEKKDDSSSKKHKKSKKKHKHKDKDKKHKKKSKKRKKDENSASESEKEVSKIKIKKENEKNKDDVTELSVNVKTEKDKEENGGEENTDKSKQKIVIKDLSSIFVSTIKEIQEKVKNTEEGELSESDNSDGKSKTRKRKHSHDHHKSSKKHKRSKSRDSEHKSKYDDSKIKDESKNKDSSRYKSKDDQKKDKRFYKERDKSKDRSKDRYKDEKSRDYKKDLEYSKRSKENSFYKDESSYRYKERDYERDEKWLSRDRYRSYNERDKDKDRKRRERSGSREDSSHIDKKKLLEIARRNAIHMMKSGYLPGALTLGPQAQEKVIAAIKAGGKTIEELTDFCKTLSKKEEMGDLSSLSDKEHSSDSDTDKPFHHPFQIKDRPTSITMNIKNSVPLPIKSTQERTSELRIQFPVSSGQQHRKTEGEWVPVSPKKTEAKSAPTPAPTVPAVSSVPLPIEPPPLPPVVPAPPNAPPGPQAFPTPMLEPTVDIGSIVSQRLTAMRRLQENPNDVQALSQMFKSNKEMQSWAQSKQQPGQFTGSTGAQILSQAELSSGFQAWVKKDQLQTAAPVSGGMGMHLLQKMGWKPGEGLGKEKSGTLEPLLLEVKLDKKGLVANEEQQKKKKGPKQPTVKTLQGKHPVSLLGEYASKRKLGAPQYVLCFECGPDHKKNFLFKVILNGIEYKPNVASANKKEAKAAAATLCLQQIGLLPS